MKLFLIGLLKPNFKCKDGNARFTTVPLRAVAVSVWIIYQCVWFVKLITFNCGFSTKAPCAFLLQENIVELSFLKTYKPVKTTLLPIFIDLLKNSRVQLWIRYCHLCRKCHFTIVSVEVNISIYCHISHWYLSLISLIG